MKRFNSLLTVLIAASVMTIAAVSCKKDDFTEKLRSDCICTMIYDPVCGCNGVTYGNGCEAECHGITQYTKGECAGK
jgi:hypothetical protein